MELARMELEHRRGPSFRHGATMGKRMSLEDDGMQLSKALKASTKRLLAQFPPTEKNLDLRSHLPYLNHAEIWEGTRALADDLARTTCTDPKLSLVKWCELYKLGIESGASVPRFPEPKAIGKILNLSGCDNAGLKPLRGFSLTLGDALTSVDLSETKVNDFDLQTFCTRLYSLRTLKLTHCDRVSNLGIKSVAICCYRTLTQLNISSCNRLTAESCGWVAGTLGCAQPACASLESLDMSFCPKMTDDALLALATGCLKLRFLSIARNQKLTDAGVVAVAKSCRRLEVIDLTECPAVGDKSLCALGRWSVALRSMLAARAGPIGNRGLGALARGCRRLATVNIAGARRVSEGALGELATCCRALRTLNVSGCEEVTSKTVRALVDGIGFVREAKNFLGFVPIDNSTQHELAAQQNELENRSARLICMLFRYYRWRRIARGQLQYARLNRAALTLARGTSKFLMRLRERRRKQELCRLETVRFLQRNWRAHRGRLFALALASQRDILRAKQRQVVSFQALFRGYLCRKHDIASVTAVLYRHRAMHHLNSLRAAATRLQAVSRSRLSRRRAAVYRQIKARLDDDAEIAAHNMQRVVRGVLAYREQHRRKVARKRRDELEAWAANMIVSLFRIIVCRSTAARLRRAAERARVLLEKSAGMVQRSTRGFFGRNDARRKRLLQMRQNQAATNIQRMFRGSRVLIWRHIRLNSIARSVFRRQEFELTASFAAASQRLESFYTALGRDSCSEDKSDEETSENAWVERRDTKSGIPTWINTHTGEEVSESPFSDPVDTELVGCSVRIYWPRMGEWYEATLSRFNKRRRRYRVEYYDGDHEWLDLDAAADRVQLFDGRGEWSMFALAYRPELELRRAATREIKKLETHAARLEEETRHWEVLDGSDTENSALEAAISAYAGQSEGVRETWFNSLTGEIRVRDENANTWMESRDEHGFFCFENGETGERVYKDPRFLPDDEPSTNSIARTRCLQSLHYCCYVISSLVDDWNKAGDDKTRRTIMKQFEEKKQIIRDMSKAVFSARELWHGDKFNENEHLVYSASLLKCALQVLEKAELQTDQDKIFKRNFIASMRRRS